MKDVELKEVARMFWIVKGHLTDESTMRECYNGYFKRMWGNHETVVHETGFDEAWSEYKRTRSL